MWLIGLTALTMAAFAANSILCRMALGGGLIDPVSFTTLRLASGAMALLLVSRWVREPRPKGEAAGSWRSGLALFAYAIAFSLAYLSLDAGTGALILFGSVQVTMIAVALYSGERPGLVQGVGFVLAIGGLVYLVFPGISAPDPLGALLMGISGLAWGAYSIRGKESRTPVAMTAGNFVRSVPMAIAGSVIAFSSMGAAPTGVVLAMVSGIFTSGLGYVLWYRVLRDLSTTQASVVQLTVPILAALGGVAFLAERMTFRLMMASVLILGGVALAVLRPRLESTVKPKQDYR